MNMNNARSATSVVFLVSAALLFGATDADAKRKRRRGKKAKSSQVQKKSAATAKQAENLAALMGDFKFGMSRGDVAKELAKAIREDYSEKISMAGDVYAQDKLRGDRDEKIAQIKKTYIAFDGKRTGWDVSIIDDEFAHNTKESMLVHWEISDGREQRRFFFFVGGKLYKMFIALNSKLLQPEQRNFAFLKEAMEARYGKGEVAFRKDSQGLEHPSAVVWRNGKLIAKAIDKIDFYDTFALSVANAKIEAKLDARRSKLVKPPKTNAVIDSVVSDDEDLGLNENADVIDSLTK